MLLVAAATVAGGVRRRRWRSRAPPAKSPFGVGPAAAEVCRRVPAPPASRAGLCAHRPWVMEKQAQFNRELAAAVRRFKTADPFSAALLLAAISFAYGVLHAAGPGHGKAVISSYVLADGRTVRRGILLSFLAALIQALSALVLVGVLVLVLRSTGLQIRAMEAWLETRELGAGGAGRRLAALLPAALGLRAGACARQGTITIITRHHHDHGAARACPRARITEHMHASRPRRRAARSARTCRPPSQLQGDWSWRRALALAFAVGMRPCTGAILVLVFAIGQGLWWAGVFSTFAMALGTAITVSVLAASAVGFRELATRLAGSGGSSKWADRVQMAAGLGGASLVLVLGAAFFWASLGAGKPF